MTKSMNSIKAAAANTIETIHNMVGELQEIHDEIFNLQTTLDDPTAGKREKFIARLEMKTWKAALRDAEHLIKFTVEEMMPAPTPKKRRKKRAPSSDATSNSPETSPESETPPEAVPVQVVEETPSGELVGPPRETRRMLLSSSPDVIYLTGEEPAELEKGEKFIKFTGDGARFFRVSVKSGEGKRPRSRWVQADAEPNAELLALSEGASVEEVEEFTFA